MKKFIAAAALLAAAFLVQGCSGPCRTQCQTVPPCQPACSPGVVAMNVPAQPLPAPAPAGEVGWDDLRHRRFVLVGMDGAAFPEVEREPDIEFNEDGSVTGRTCNQFHGQGVLENGILRIERMAGTRMFCVQPELNQLENLFSAMMQEGAEVLLDDAGLTLKQGGHELVYKRADWVR